MKHATNHPVIGIVGMLETPPASSPFVGVDRQITNEAYTRAVQLAGGTPLLLPVPADVQDASVLQDYITLCDGLLFQGGYDIDPSNYGEQSHELLGEVNMRTDAFQIKLYKLAKEAGLPILGICRGLQLINVAEGGTLWQDQSLRPKTTTIQLNHSQYANAQEGCHQAFITPGSTLSSLFPGPHLLVNSLHHQQLHTVGDGLQVVATSEDDGIEAVEAINTPPWICGVQWHPEAMLLRNDMMFPLFLKLVQEARRT